ncbi:hypothetical protein [Desulfobulbus sp.]|uniref:hypothetical protein n=1 Tax=Desulfobulbus sp. TaxID=895 RepID=UPI00286EF74A|nr:hypothetical protein [Desulfobulbus sp.]
MPGDAEFSPEDPAARIRARMKERRVLEARFLLRQFSDGIETEQRQALEREVSRLLAEVERLRHLARSAAAEGRREEAGKLYRDIERLVVDVPGLSEERAALAGAEAVFSRLSSRPDAARQPGPADGPPLATGRDVALPEQSLAGTAGAGQGQPVAASVDSSVSATAALPPPRRSHRFRGLWLAVIAGAGLAVLVLLLIWQGRSKEPPAILPASPGQTPARNLTTRPLPSDVPTSSPLPTSPDTSATPVVALPPASETSMPAATAAIEPQPAPAQEPAARLSPPPEPKSPPLPPPRIEPAPAQAVAPRVPAPQPTFRLGTLQVEKSKKVKKSNRK